jgi:siroheme synthase (precorrin-2 oxidase/ferrochelatase)
MSITMKLDTPAVRALIKDDDKFELELQQSVINEIVGRIYDKSIPTALRQMIHSACQDAKQNVLDAVKDDVGFRAHVDQALSAMVQSIRSSTNSYTVQKTLSDEVKRMIGNHISQLVEEEVEKRKEALGMSADEMIARMERKFEAEIERKLGMMDRAYQEIARRKIMEKIDAFTKEQQA